MHDLCKEPWDCRAEHPDFEQLVREIIATTREQEEGKQFSRLDWVACVFLLFPKLGSLLRVLLFLVVPPCGMPTAHGWHGSR